MTEAINCQSCGAANRLPEGKTSMFCAFCGGSIVKIDSTSDRKNEIESAIRVKPEISKRKTINEDVPIYDEYSRGLITYVKEEIVTQEGGELSLVNRNINSLQDIIYWFSDNELDEIRVLKLSNNKINNLEGINRFNSLEVLDISSNNITSLEIPSLSTERLISIDKIILSNNKITSLKGISLFNCKELDVSDNDIQVLDDLPTNNKEFDLINLNNNRNLTSFSEMVKNRICQLNGRFTLAINGCVKFDYNNIIEIIKRKNSIHFWLNIKKGNALPNELYAIGFEKNYQDEPVYDYYRYPKFTDPALTKAKSSNCFIATATMGSYEHPTVVELRHFRDSWLLKKQWGESFVEWYYHYGAIAAKFIEKSFVLKKISYLLIVKPLVYLSRIMK